MPQFTYKAKAGVNQIVSGVIEATTQQEAVEKIMKLGQTPIDVAISDLKVAPTVVRRAAEVKPKVVRRVSTRALVIFIRQLADLVDAGVPLVRCLDILRQQKGMEVFKACLGDMVAQIKEGKSLSAAMATYPMIFSGVTINMVKAGESSGSLSQVLSRLADVMEQDQVLTQKLKGAMIYPIMVMGVGILTLVALLVFVLPKLTGLFDDLDMTLPGITQFVMGLSAFISQWGWLMLLVIILASSLWIRWVQKPEGRQWQDNFLLGLPAVGAWISKVELSRWARLMGTLIHSGMTVVAAMDTAVAVCDNSQIRRQLKEAVLSVRSGRALTQAIASTRAFDEMTISLLKVGEESGDMSKAFLKIASIYERESTHQATVAADIAGPLVLIVIVGIVGVMVVSMLLPIFQMNLMVN